MLFDTIAKEAYAKVNGNFAVITLTLIFVSGACVCCYYLSNILINTLCFISLGSSQVALLPFLNITSVTSFKRALVKYQSPRFIETDMIYYTKFNKEVKDMNENNMSTVAIAAINKTNNDITILLIFGMLILGCFLTNTKNN